MNIKAEIRARALARVRARRGGVLTQVEELLVGIAIDETFDAHLERQGAKYLGDATPMDPDGAAKK